MVRRPVVSWKTSFPCGQKTLSGVGAARALCVPELYQIHTHMHWCIYLLVLAYLFACTRLLFQLVSFTTLTSTLRIIKLPKMVARRCCGKRCWRRGVGGLPSISCELFFRLKCEKCLPFPPGGHAFFDDCALTIHYRWVSVCVCVCVA